MNDMSIPSGAILAKLSTKMDELTPEQRKAAAWVLENPNAVGISSVRDVAEAADVKPNTVVRLARQAGFEGFEDFRIPFREAIRSGPCSFPDRARWLQSLSKDGQLGALYHDMLDAAFRNIEDTFAGISEADLRNVAKDIWTSRKVYILGVGVNHSNASNFGYLAATGMSDFHAIPRPGSTAVDDLARTDHRDILIAITCKPYRAEVVKAMAVAREQGLKIVGISDSAASPVIVGADHGFVVSADTPQFFPSSVSTIALLETLMSFVIAVASDEIVDRVETFHKRRHQLGIYVEDDTG
ncbi:MAG: MurR/RpiR family transcriptional regulator [Rhodobacteraceae bacterium]|nr:MurR/RpiR family transcriptional regulator [Paracoccaceae bacterium]